MSTRTGPRIMLGVTALALTVVLVPTGNLHASGATPAGAAQGVGAAGTDWVRMDLPPGIGPDAQLYGVSAPDSANAWAVGTEAMTGGEQSPLVLRLRGGRWSKVSLPGITWPGELRRVAAVSRNDVWAAGTDLDRRARLLHWNGRSWREATFPGSADPGLDVYAMVSAPGHGPWLFGRSAAGPKFLLRRTATGWADVALPPSPFDAATLGVAPDGQLWVAGVVPGLDGSSVSLRLYRVVNGVLRLGSTGGTAPAVQPNDVVAGPEGVWLGGDYRDQGRTAIVNWDGRAWHESLLPADTAGIATVVADARGRPAWALGTYQVDEGTWLPGYLKYARGTWITMASAPTVAPEIGRPEISSVSAVPGTQASLAVGSIATGGGLQPRIERESAP